MLENASAYISESIADYGAQRTLGINGSITGYINTGNQYDTKYYKNSFRGDCFTKKTPEKKKTNVNKILLIASSIGIAGLSLFALIKSGKINFECIKTVPQKISQFAKDGFSKVKSIFKK